MLELKYESQNQVLVNILYAEAEYELELSNQRLVMLLEDNDLDSYTLELQFNADLNKRLELLKYLKETYKGEKSSRPNKVVVSYITRDNVEKGITEYVSNEYN